MADPADRGISDRGVIADLRSYYEHEASQQFRGPLQGRRVELRSEFVELLVSENRSSVVDFGAGPGFDADGFHPAGVDYVGVDLAHGNGKLAAARGVTVVHGSIAAPPFRNDAFDAGWSMSTLMHVPEAEVPAALAAMVGPLAAGAPLMVAQWGGELGDQVDDTKLPGERRLFSHRPFDRNRELLAAVGTIERAECWLIGPEAWEYHVIQIRT